MTGIVKQFDVRPFLSDGGDPFSAIMAAVAQLAPGETFQLLSSFEPKPLFKVMAERGFSNHATEVADGEWEVLFIPRTTEAEDIYVSPALAGEADEPQTWPEPLVYLDLSSEPLDVQTDRIVSALERLPSGSVIFALLSGEPTSLYPGLIEKGHQWAGNFDETRTVFRVFIRAGLGSH